MPTDKRRKLRGSRGRRRKGQKKKKEEEGEEEEDKAEADRRREGPDAPDSGGEGRDGAEQAGRAAAPDGPPNPDWMQSSEEGAGAGAGGHFYRLDPEVQQYFKSVEKTLENMEPSLEEESNLFLGNVFSEIDGKEADLATDHECSRVLEKLLRQAPDQYLRVFFDKLNGRFVELFVHRFASHVCETVMTLAAVAVNREMLGVPAPAPGEDEGDGDKGPVLSIEQLVVNMCKQILPSWSALMADPYGSHALRTLLTLLSGRPFAAESRGGARSKKSIKYNENNNNTADMPWVLTKARAVPASFTSALQDIFKEIAGVSDVVIRSSAGSLVANPVLQRLLTLEAEHKSTALLDRVLMGLASEEKSNDDPKAKHDRDSYMETLLKSAIGSHLLETIIEVAPTDVYLRLYTTYFRNRLARLCAHPFANYVVQHLLRNAKAKVVLELMVKEVVPEFEGYLANRRSGVIRSLVEAAVRLKACEEEIVNGVCKAFHATDEERKKVLVQLILRMETYESYEAGKNEPKKLDTQGALIVQKMLELPEKHSGGILKSYFAQPRASILAWAKDPTGSRVVDAVLSSPAVSLDDKRRALSQFDGKFHELALDKYGSHVVDRCWAVADIDLKEKIAGELVAHQRELSNSFHGKFVLRNCRIESFQSKREEWKTRQAGAQRKRELFADIIGDEPAVKKAKKSKGR